MTVAVGNVFASSYPAAGDPVSKNNTICWADILVTDLDTEGNRIALHSH